MFDYPMLVENLPMIVLYSIVGMGAPVFSLPGLLPARLFREGSSIAVVALFGLLITATALLSHLVLQGIAWLTGSAEIPVWIGPPVLLMLYIGIWMLIPAAIRKRWDCLHWYDVAGLFLLSGALALVPYWSLPELTGSLMPSLFHVVASGLGFTGLLMVLGSIRIRLHASPVPDLLQGLPSLLLAGGLIALILLGSFSLFQ